MARRATKDNPYKILVTGDVVIDNHIYRGNCVHPAEGDCTTLVIPRLGGAGQSAQLLDDMCKGSPLLSSEDGTPDFSDDMHLNRETHHAYATWTEFAPTRKPNGKKSPKVWRVNETFGFGTVISAIETIKTRKASSASSYDVIVIDEGALGFRDSQNDWPAVLNDMPAAELPWIVLKMSAPVCQGELWTRLNQKPFLDRLIVLVAADDLRRSNAFVSKGLSWEKSVRELLGDLTFDQEFQGLAHARHLIVNFGHDGALWINNSDPLKPERSLIFDPGNLEGNWEEHLEGSVLGSGACLLCSVVLSLFEMDPIKGAKEDKNGNRPMELTLTDGRDLASGIARGLAARRALLQSGHGTDPKQPEFPLEDVRKALVGPRSGGFSWVSVPEFAVPDEPDASRRDGPAWSILAGNSLARKRKLFGRAREVALHGESALKNIPYGRFRKLYTVDSIELNGFYAVQKLIKDYVYADKAETPLSLGVFGPPGSGKSFGIKEIARGIMGNKTPILTFNLSQFPQKEMLIGAFHQVRDEVLKGEVPVVFWDEFDCDQLSWLQYLLAPMSDGEFLEGQVTHPIGKCIFIFAGGTCKTMKEFQETKKIGEGKTFKALKGPDFVSRLKGYLNVLGPNPRKIDGIVDPSDLGYPIRRAIMLRVQAGKFDSDYLDIDPGLLNAMLKIDEFTHGARSIQTIVHLITGGGKRGLLRSNIPPREQLGLHVKYDQFMTLVQAGADLNHDATKFKAKSKVLGPKIHKFYLDLAAKEGWKPKYGMEWEAPPPDVLPEHIKDDNCSAAWRLPDVLSLAGLIVVGEKNGPGANPVQVDKIIEENIECLAEAEHDGWVETKLEKGWTWKEIRNDDEQEHPAMKPYKDLRPVDQGKDRDAVGNYPEIVPLAGFVIQLEEDIDSRYVPHVADDNSEREKQD